MALVCRQDLSTSAPCNATLGQSFLPESVFDGRPPPRLGWIGMTGGLSHTGTWGLAMGSVWVTLGDEASRVEMPRNVHMHLYSQITDDYGAINWTKIANV
jgi:hypothetical protein